MSTPISPTPPEPPAGSAAPPTRQLLDELDALMQRMLALPVNQLEEQLGTAEEEIPPSAAEAPPLSDSADESENPPPVPETQAEGGPPFAPLGSEAALFTEGGSGPEKSEADWGPILPAGPEILAAIGQRQPEGESAGARSNPPSPATIVPSHTPTLALGHAAVPGWLRPLVWANRCFDGATAWMGPPGRWLRGESGRAVLGWVGLGLTAGAIAWVIGMVVGA